MGVGRGAWSASGVRPQHCVLVSCAVAGANGPGAPEPGEEPAVAGSAAGLRGPGPLPPGGQPVAGLLLVLRQPAGHVGRGRHADLHAEAPVRRQKAGAHVTASETESRGSLLHMFRLLETTSSGGSVMRLRARTHTHGCTRAHTQEEGSSKETRPF